MRSIKSSGVIPAARTEGLLVERVGDEIVVYDTETKQAHCLKPLAGLVFESADGSCDAAAIAAVATSRLCGPVNIEQVLEAVDQLEQVGLLASPLVVLSSGNGVSRRDVVKRIGKVGALAASVPLVLSVVAPSAAFASGIPTGCTGCTGNGDCLSGHCCQNNGGKKCNQSCCVGGNNSCQIDAAGNCSVTVADSGCGACPCSVCPAGSVICCT